MTNLKYSALNNKDKFLHDMGDGTFADPVVAQNITTKFREAFEGYVPGLKWLETKATGDIVALRGNAIASSWLEISKDPFQADTETVVEGIANFDMPIEMSIGAHFSQRTLGQEFSIEVVDVSPSLTPVPEIAILDITQAGTTLTVNTATPHDLVPGKAIGIDGVSDSRLNYPALVVASIPSPTQFTVTAGAGGTNPSLTVGPLTGGTVFFRSRLGFAQNGTSMIFENANTTQASFYVRSEAGDSIPSGTPAGNHGITVGSTISVQPITAAKTYASQPTTEYRLNLQSDRVQWSDVAADSLSQASNRHLRGQVVPSSEKDYKLRLRAKNNKSLSRPVAQIVSAVKSGATTATITTDVPHGLTVNDQVVIYGIRDQSAAAFPNLITASAILSVVNATSFTIAIGTASTVTSYGGYVAKINGSNLMSALGASAIAVQSAILSAGILSLTGSAAWAGFVIGDLVNVYGVRSATNGATLGIDGVYVVRNINAAIAELGRADGVAMPTDFGSVNCGGSIIKRTSLRVSYVRLFDFERLRVETLPRPANDQSSSFPVTVQNSVAVTATGVAAHDATISGNPLRVSGRAITANYAAVQTGDVADLITTLVGALITKPYAIPEQGWTASLALTTATPAVLQAAAGAGLKRHITAIQAINSGATSVDLIILDGATERWRLPLPVDTPVMFEFPTELPTTANQSLNANLSAAGTVRINAQGYTAP